MTSTRDRRPLTPGAYRRRGDLHPLPEALKSAIDQHDPALRHVALAVAEARAAGHDVHDPDVIATCIATGRAAHQQHPHTLIPRSAS